MSLSVKKAWPVGGCFNTSFIFSVYKGLLNSIIIAYDETLCEAKNVNEEEARAG